MYDRMTSDDCMTAPYLGNGLKYNRAARLLGGGGENQYSSSQKFIFTECKMWCKFWITSKSKFTSSSNIKCKDGSFNPCKGWCKFIKFTWKFTAFSAFVEKTGVWYKIMCSNFTLNAILNFTLTSILILPLDW